MPPAAIEAARREAGQGPQAGELAAIADKPQAVWLTSSTIGGASVFSYVRLRIHEAARQRALAVFVAYDLP